MTQEDRELLRQAVVGYLAARQGLEFTSGAIKRSIVSRGGVDFPVDDQDVEQALEFGADRKWLNKRDSDVGATVYWRVTSEGVLTAERKGWLL